ncbi:MAG: hypothetical protein RL701_2755, partial [Pseudomonadota bacterium]
RAIAIIPARGGSRRLPGKNIRLFDGVPIIAHPIRAALEYGGFDRVMTSTDSPQIADSARSHGAEVPFMRSAVSANDHATTVEVLLEVLEGYKELGSEFDLGCCIYPCNPFVTAEKLRQGRERLEANGFDCVLSAVRYAHPVQRSFTVEDGRVALLHPEQRDTRSQDLPAVLHDAAQFYWFDVKSLQTTRTVWTANTGCVEVPELEAQDIDTLQDWTLAELKYKCWKANQHQ